MAEGDERDEGDEGGTGGDVMATLAAVRMPYLSVVELAQVLGVHKTALYLAIREGRLRSERVMGKAAVSVEEAKRYAAELRPNARVGRGRPGGGGGERRAP